MNRRLLAAVAGIAVLGGTAAGTYVIASPGGEEEALQQVETATSSESATPTPTLPPVPTVLPLPTLPSVPADWLTYADPVLGFSLRYPPDLVLTDTGPSPQGGLQERDLVVRSAQDRSRVFSISIIESNPRGLTIDEWAVEFAACNPKSTQEGLLAGIRAIFCSREVVEGRSQPSVLAEHGGRIFLISAGSTLTDSEFSAVLQSFQF